ncbi:MAG: flagellar hook-associated protein 3 [Myxococcales bacterium]|nr:flagellar hook-associated protein 3 [Myxococcales bacterium]
MRISDKMIFDSSVIRNSNHRSRMEKAMAETSTGRRVVHPWDDPVAAGRIAYHNNNEKQWEGVINSAERAASELQTADDVLGNIQNVLTRAYELSVQLANDTYNPEDREAGAIELATLQEEVFYYLNTSVGGRYIFGGIEDNKPPFDNAGNFEGSAIQRRSEIAPGLTTESSINASKYFTAAGGGVDAYTILTDLNTSMLASDKAGIQTGIGGLKDLITQVSNARADAGTQQNFFDIAIETGMFLRDQENNRSASLSDADIIDAASRLQMAERALEASLTASVKSFRLTLLDKI